jgi:hypothetical protein
MRSDSAPLGIYCIPAAAKVSPCYVYMAREESRGRVGASRRVTYRTCHTGNKTSTRQLPFSQQIMARTGMLLAAVRKTRMASLVDGRGERAELCQPRESHQERCRTGCIRCREGAFTAPMARKRREAVVIARWAEDMGMYVTGSTKHFAPRTARHGQRGFSGLPSADCLLLRRWRWVRGVCAYAVLVTGRGDVNSVEASEAWAQGGRHWRVGDRLKDLEGLAMVQGKTRGETGCVR